MSEISGKVYLFVGGLVGGISLILNQFVYKDNSMSLFVLLGGLMLIYGFFKYLTTKTPDKPESRKENLGNHHHSRNMHNASHPRSSNHSHHGNVHNHQTHLTHSVSHPSNSGSHSNVSSHAAQSNLQKRNINPHGGSAGHGNAQNSHATRAQPNSKRCHKCGNHVKHYDNFCSNCGHRLR